MEQNNLLVRHHVDKVSVVYRLEIEMAQVLETCRHSEGHDTSCRLLLIFLIELFQKLCEVNAVLENTSTVISTGVFLNK